MEWADAKKIFGAQMIYNWIVITKKLAQEMGFFEGILYGVWVPLGSPWIMGR